MSSLFLLFSSGLENNVRRFFLLPVFVARASDHAEGMWWDHKINLSTEHLK